MESIFPIDLFPFLVCPPVIRDANLINPDPGYPGDLGSHLRLKSEPLLAQVYLLDNFSPEKFITGFHIREIQVGKHIGPVSYTHLTLPTTPYV